MARDSVSIEEIGKRAVRVATKAPLTAAQLADKMKASHPQKHPFTARGIGKGLAAAVRAKKLLKNEKDRPPTYSKP